ncbi:MAG: 2-C-methyl-D-erythritol 4-phosphate cytidylyltransferase, partial [Bacteroidaceae bacterium]|nr:2-C-methyl-D-erythritol 4-phosphate cytidylyltransferase [Bacteroidaceae bacterium]
MDRYAILVAGGKGLRMGSDIPKQFLPLRGRPVLMHTIDVFRRTYPDIHIILVLPREQQDYWRQLCGQHDYDVELCVADGGETRFHSVRNGLSLIPDGARGVVGVHDGVRPFVSPETIRRCFEAAEEFGAVVPVVPVVETVRQVLADGGSMTVDRNAYRLVQTPQTFDIQLLKKAYGQPFDPFFTDDASVVEAMGHPI